MNPALAPAFTYQNDTLCAESVPLSRIAEQFGTPCYVYSRGALSAALSEFQTVLAQHPAGQDALVEGLMRALRCCPATAPLSAPLR